MTNREIRCLAVDDEPLALTQLSTYIQRVPGLILVAQCSSAMQALEVISRGGVDLLFADISMPDMNGVELVRHVAGRCLVVFTTAYADYAVDGYKVEAVDYLLKPFSLADVALAAERVRRRLAAEEALLAQTNAALTSNAHSVQNMASSHLKPNAGTSDVTTNAIPTATTTASPEADAERRISADDFIFVKNDAKMSRIKVCEIAVVEGMSEYVRIFTVGASKPYTTHISMKKMEAQLPADIFMRVHRSWIANLTKIESVSHMRITIAGQLVAVSDNYKEPFLAYLDSHAIR